LYTLIDTLFEIQNSNTVNAPRIFIGEHYTLVADILITRFTNHKKGYHPIHLFCDLAMSPYWYYFGLVIDDGSFGLAE
jgi:hypothetical protein